MILNSPFGFPLKRINKPDAGPQRTRHGLVYIGRVKAFIVRPSTSGDTSDSKRELFLGALELRKFGPMIH